MRSSDTREGSDVALSDETAALLMLNKEERKLIKELLLMAMHSESVRSYIVKKLGNNYIEIGQQLLKTM